MKRLTLIVLLSFTTVPLFAFKADNSGDADKMKTLFQCGVGTESGFDGWKLDGLSHEAITYFEKDYIEFFQHTAGEYNISFTKRIEEMIGFTDLLLSVDMESIERCAINHATAYVSKDGKTWVPLQTDARYGAQIYSEKMEFLFVKLVADVTFFQQGRFRLNRAAVYGNYHVRKRKPDAELLDLAAMANGPMANQINNDFFIFSYDKKINIETKNDKHYQFILTNLLGQVILKERSRGSRRFETDVPDGIYFVTIMQGDKLITTRKVVL